MIASDTYNFLWRKKGERILIVVELVDVVDVVGKERRWSRPRRKNGQVLRILSCLPD
jgi:hypothetical protein